VLARPVFVAARRSGTSHGVGGARGAGRVRGGDRRLGGVRVAFCCHLPARPRRCPARHGSAGAVRGV